MEEPQSGESPHEWRLQRWLRQHRSTRDIITAQVGEYAENIVVGKNIIQIGKLGVPLWAVFAGLTLLIIMTGFVSYPWFIPFFTPVRMPNGQYNIAVAPFALQEKQAHTTIESPELSALGEHIAKFLADQADILTTYTRDHVEVWGPSHGIKPVQPGSEAQRASALNVSVLVYGHPEQKPNGQWVIKPSFYVTDRAIEQVDELRGAYALGSPIDYGPGNISDINDEMNRRIAILVQMLVGLQHMATGTEKGYQRAVKEFQGIITNSKWSQEQGAGQEILYLFLGDALLKQVSLMQPNQPERRALLIQSRDAFSKSLMLNPDYQRADNGVGAANYLLAVADGCSTNSKQLLTYAQDAFTNALKPNEDKAQSGYVDLRAQWYLGRVGLFRFLCGDALAAQAAQKDYEMAITLYNNEKNPPMQLMESGVFIHFEFGLLLYHQGDKLLTSSNIVEKARGQQLLNDAIDHYKTSINLIKGVNGDDSTRLAIQIIPAYLQALCEIGFGEDIGKAFDSAVEGHRNQQLKSEIEAKLKQDTIKCIKGEHS